MKTFKFWWSHLKVSRRSVRLDGPATFVTENETRMCCSPAQDNQKKFSLDLQYLPLRESNK